MKFVADENVPKQLVIRLQAEGHEIDYIAETGRKLQDRTILRIAITQVALVVTYDKDFRYYTLEEKQPSLGVLWVRRLSRGIDLYTEIARVVEIVQAYGEKLWNHLTIIYPDHVEQHPVTLPGT